jgi:hypothetical protein
MQALINAGNWRTADQVVLDDVERWSYTANEVLAKNHYFGGIHNGLNEGWQILPWTGFHFSIVRESPCGSAAEHTSGRRVSIHYFREPLGSSHLVFLGRTPRGCRSKQPGWLGHVLLVLHGQRRMGETHEQMDLCVTNYAWQFPGSRAHVP